MAESHHTVARTNMILDLLAQAGPLTNMEIAESLYMKYRTVQRITNKLATEGLIWGQLNVLGRGYSNVSWRIKPDRVGPIGQCE